MIYERIIREDSEYSPSEIKKRIIEVFSKKGYDYLETSNKRNVKITKNGEIFEFGFSILFEKVVPGWRDKDWKYVVSVKFNSSGVPSGKGYERFVGRYEIRIVGGVEHKKELTTVHHNPFILILQRVFGRKPEDIYSDVREALRREIDEIKKEMLGFL